MVRALPHGSDTRIDVGRIAAIAAAIAVHAAALLMLLMPMAAPPLAAPTKPKEQVRWYPKEEVKPKPVEAEIIKQVTPAQAEASVRNAAHYVEHGRLHAAEAKKDLTFCR